MKKLIVALLFMFILYVIYYDLSKGVMSTPTSVVLLPKTEKTPPENKDAKEGKTINKEKNNSKSPDSSKKEDLYFQEVKVTAGQTVLSIVEQIHNGPLPVSISQLITDFQILNPKTEPERIQIGKVYKFPVYNEPEE